MKYVQRSNTNYVVNNCLYYLHCVLFCCNLRYSSTKTMKIMTIRCIKQSYMKYLPEDDIKEVPRQFVSNFGHAPFTYQSCSNLIKDTLRIFQ